MTPSGGETVFSRPKLQIVTSRGCLEWLAAEHLSLAMTTYHGGGVIMLGTKPDRCASVHVAAFDRSMGCWSDGQTLWLVTEHMLWRLSNNLPDGQLDERGYDRVFAPRVGYVIGEVDGHEVSVGEGDQPVFVNTAFSCLATCDPHYSFRPLWRPPFISRLAPEDRCHLNGLAVVDGQPRYVSMHARSDVADGWRDFRERGGTIMDCQSNEIVCEGLSMPHSPRWHAGKLWVLNSGTGFLGTIDLSTGKFEPVTFLPGYARGLAFHGNAAIVGLSKPRREHAFQGLPLEDNLRTRTAAARCGFCIVELRTGSILHWARIESEMEELFDVTAIPGARRPKVLSLATNLYARQLTCIDGGRRRRWAMDIGSNASPAPEPPSRRGSPADPLAPRRTPHRQAKGLNNLGLKHREAGDMSAAEHCFEQAIQRDPEHVGALNNLGNIYRQAGRLEQAVEMYRRALQVDPRYARAYVNLGQTLTELGRYVEAGGCFHRALKVDPDLVEAGVGLGMALKEQGKFNEATRCFNQALILDPHCWPALNGLGLVHKELDEIPEAMERYTSALAINPQAAPVLANLGLALRELGRMDEALDLYDRALEIDPDCVAAHHNRSMLRLAVGDFECGWPEYEWRWKQPRVRAPYTQAPLWDGSPLQGRTILLHAEQGRGDVIQFVRYAALVKQQGGRVLLSAAPDMLQLLGMASGIDQLVSRDDPPPAHDVQAALMSLPACFGTTLESIPADVPYVTPPTNLVEHWRTALKVFPGLKIGIAWQGNPEFPADKSRSVSLARFAPIAEISGVTLFSLQKGFGVEQIGQVAESFDVVELGGPGNEQLDFPDTAALASCLDLVISVDTSIGHLSGAMGLPVWVALADVPDWRFMLDRDDSPWYPSMRLFRQRRRGDWAEVFGRMAGACQQLM